ncbi:phosphoenolpyruvate synthase [Candidatus Dependentiae bacterium HGW-Dependentiae-1]|nr:MAG: phosphoenolpyruvate synthase [Candidatus Dependentiae bacterium HGW-Dependentiae-1]
MKFILPFSQITLADIARVGGKNASLGQMISVLRSKQIRVPDGFAVTAQAYWHYLDHNKLLEPIKKIMSTLHEVHESAQLQKVGREIRELIVQGEIPADLLAEISAAYKQLSQEYGVTACDVAVRSSATAEDLPTASFAGQQETFLNVSGNILLAESYKKCLASLFTDRAIFYRREQGFDDFQVALSVGVQKMVRSDVACSGVAFSLDTETGHKDVVMIDASWGLGEAIVKGIVVPDEYVVHKSTLRLGYASIVKKQVGDKRAQMVYQAAGDAQVALIPVPEEKRSQYCLSDEEILSLARDVLIIEEHYSQLHGRWTPMDVEWAKDGTDDTLYIIQARPETLHGAKGLESAGQKKASVSALTQYRFTADVPKKLLVSGVSIGQKIASGPARIIKDVADINQVRAGDILVTHMTDPDWVPAMKKAAGVITEQGGRTCHAAIVGRELGVPVIVGASGALQTVQQGQEITLDCSQGAVGYIYEGLLPFETITDELGEVPVLPVELMLNLADPDRALTLAALPVAGVGLARLEFIITNAVKIHPLALVHPELVTDAAVCKTIEQLTSAHTDKKQFFIDTLAQGIGMIAAAFYPRPVIVRLSDFKTNEYRNLIGGSFFEPEEENPMLGFRGASRYYHPRYREAFALECAAFVKARDVMGLTNIKVMVPFVRTIAEGEKVLAEMAKNGLVSAKYCPEKKESVSVFFAKLFKKIGLGKSPAVAGVPLEVIMMCEIPSNVLLIDEFSKLFDGISIGSNDLTQLTLGVDRDSALLNEAFDERDPAVKKMFKIAVEGAVRNKIYSGICGQAPSDYPEIADFLIEAGIQSISLNSYAVMPFMLRYKTIKK